MSENDKDPQQGEFTDPTASPDWTTPGPAQDSTTPEPDAPQSPQSPQSAPTEQIPQGFDPVGTSAEQPFPVPPAPSAPGYDAPYAPPYGDTNPYAGSSAQPANPYAATPPPPPQDPYAGPQPSYDPYAAQQPAYDPYAASGAPAQPGGYPAYQAPGQWQAPPAAYGAPPPQNTSALVLTILSGLGLVACCQVIMIGSLILGILGLTKNATDPEGSRRLTKWGWVVFAVSIALSIIGVIVFFVAGSSGMFDGGGYDSDYSY